MNYALSRTSADGGPRINVGGEHRPPAGREVVLVRVIQAQPAVALASRPVPGGLVLSEPGPPALPVLPVPLGPLTVDPGRAGGFGDVVKAGITATPAAAAALGEPVLGQDPQRGRRRRGAQPRRPGHLGTADLSAVEHLVDEPGCAAKQQEHRVYAVDPPSTTATPANRLCVSVRDPERDPVRPGHPAPGHDVEQRVGLGVEHGQEPGHRPLREARVQRQVPGTKLQHG
jgi:hypothetical protein